MGLTLNIYPDQGVIAWRHAIKQTGSMASGFGTADSPVTLFTVTGDVIASVFAICNTSLTGATAALSVGDAATTGGILASTIGTTMDATEIWHGTSVVPTTAVGTAIHRGKYLTNGANIILTIATADVTAGDLSFHCFWHPLSVDGKVEAA